MSADDGAGFASVAIPVPLRQLFTYRVAGPLARRLSAGTRVRVPFGPRKVTGTVVDWPAPPPDPGIVTKPIESIVEDPGPLPPAILELTRFVSEYYLCSWGEAIEAALPPGSGRGVVRRIARRLPTADPEGLDARATAQRRLLEALPADGTARFVSELDAAQRRALVPLRERGWIEVAEAPRQAPDLAPARDRERPESGPTPTQAQQSVLEQLDPHLGRHGFETFLLFGATGSGKTEVYFRAARRVLDAGRSVLYLVPEIGLTPLLLSKVKRRFPGVVEVMHSGLARRRRSDAWERVHDGRSRFVLGTRSAIFAPLHELGLIVVDEEQDGSYKQEETPRYNARDLAVVRGRQEGAVVLLGSATPSTETFHHAVSGRYGMLRLGGRVEARPLPTVEFVDMRDEYRERRQVSPISSRLAEALHACVARGEQALILRNRRGWSAAVLCPTCGNRVSCGHCSIAMTWHRAQARLRCHYCGLEEVYPSMCPTCGAAELNLLGEGTEQIEDLIRAVVPQARIARMDRDSIRRKGAHEALLRRFDRGEIDVMVGTQMIAKGHDFPRVTLVGVLSADHSLGLPDFRAGERVFQLLTQVAGRAGRGELPGGVLIQAFDPEQRVLRQAARQDYEAFYEDEIRYRKALRYPPIAGLVQIIVHDKQEHRSRYWAAQLAAALRRVGDRRLLIGGPGPAPIERLKGRWRQQILLRTAGRRRLIAAVARAVDATTGEIPRKALQVDVDPYSLL